MKLTDSILPVLLAGSALFLGIALVLTLAGHDRVSRFRSRLRDAAMMSQVRRGSKRAREHADLPFYLELIVICLESGTTLSGAIEHAVRMGPGGELNRQLARLLAEQRAGRSLRDALVDLGERADAAEIETFASACVAAQLYGADLARVLRELASQVRDRLYLDAEQRALRAPVKMIAPLVLCIFPCTFIVLAFPIASTLIRDGLL